MFRKAISDKASNGYYDSTPRRPNNLKEEPIISERKLALSGIILSIVVITAKLYERNHESLKNVLFERRLVSYEEITTDGELMLTYAWKNAARFSRYWLPALCGLLTTYFTWVMVYLDSSVPGVYPPSPLSPTKYSARTQRAFHLNYIFAIIVGFLVFCYTLWKGVSIEF